MQINPNSQRNICNEGQMYEIMSDYTGLFSCILFTQKSLIPKQHTGPWASLNHTGCNINCFIVSKAITLEAVKKNPHI